MGTFSLWHWAVVLLIVVMVFGTKKFKNLGADLGSAVNGFKRGVQGTEDLHTSGQASAQDSQGTPSSASGKSSQSNG